MPRAPKALARTGPDALGTGALSNLNSTGAHTARIGSRRPSTDLCFSSIEPHPTTTAFSVPGHSRSSRPGELRGEGDGRGNRGPIFTAERPGPHRNLTRFFLYARRYARFVKRVRPRVSTANRTVPIFHLERSCSSGRRALARGDRASRLAALGYQPKKDAPQTHESLAPKCLLDPVRFFECREAPKRTARPQFAFCTAFPKGVKRERSRRNWRPSPRRLRHRCNAHSVNR